MYIQQESLSADRTPAAIAGGEPLECEVFTDFAPLEGRRAEWDTAVEGAGGSVYMTFDWVRTWWQYYGGEAQLRLFVFTCRGRIVALSPLYVETLGAGPLRLRVARLVGANIPPKVFNPPVPAWCAEAVLTTISRHLLEKGECDVFSYGPVSETHEAAPALQRISTGGAIPALKCETVETIHTIFELPRDMEEYYASLSKNERKQRRKYELRRLKKEHETFVEVARDPESAGQAFEQFREQHARQWQEENRTGHFGAWPDGLEFNRSLVKAHAELDRVRFIRIVAGGQVIAGQYVFVFGGRYYWELPAREPGSYWEPFSLGPTGIVTMIGEAIAEGVTSIEGGLAHYDYKLRLGAREYKALTYRFSALGVDCGVRLAVFSVCRAVTRLAYHALWYRRIQPRLPKALWWPQWRFWLGLDF